MTCEAEHRPLGVFECQLCALAAPYSYVGQKPPDTQSVILLEESYVMKDPFTPDKDRFLILGSRNAVCSTPRGSASLVSRRTSRLSLRRSGRTWRKGKAPRRGRPASPARRPEPASEAPSRVLSWEPPCGLVLEPCRGGTWEPHPDSRGRSVLSAGRSQGAPRLSRGWGPTLCRSSRLCPAPHGWAGGPCVLPTRGPIQGLSPRATPLCWALNTAARGKGLCRGAVPACGPLAPAVGGGSVCSLWLWFQPQAPGSLPSRPRLGAFCCLPAPLPSELSLGPAEANPTASALRVGARLLSAGSWRQALP
uniref:Cysteine-rich DPF motif domain-containing protein 1 n=1 Tax=Myotis myotis TaxID=51298 RepID=A0A7J7Z159_MYOMY|nr:cysteine rich DPF motif domain containing 1 [Myotis myotis]